MGYTGQYADNLSGFDYYVARYYDPVSGRFLSVDTKQDNLHGFDPYAYVNGNPETQNDPTGKCPMCIGAVAGAIIGAAADYGWQVYNNYQHHDTNPWGHINWWQVGGAALAGGLIGGTLGAALPLVTGAGASAGTVAAVGTADTVGTAVVAEENSVEAATTDATTAATDSTTTTASNVATRVLQTQSEMEDAILRDLSSSQPGDRLAGTVGSIVDQYSKLVSYGRVEIDPVLGKTTGDVDVESPNAIIEATVSTGGKAAQILKLLTNTQLNPEGKPVILYAPKYTSLALQAIEKTLSAEQWANFYLAKTPEDLRVYLALIEK
jgi:RHS repeat-associated protein